VMSRRRICRCRCRWCVPWWLAAVERCFREVVVGGDGGRWSPWMVVVEEQRDCLLMMC
jgi:hypothetical protein